jgi:hypothetical protein
MFREISVRAAGGEEEGEVSMIRRCRLLVAGPLFGALTSLAPATAGAGAGAQLGENLHTIYGAWRGAGYRGAIVPVTVYSNNYANLAATTLIARLDGAVVRHTAALGGVVADGFGAFRNASAVLAGAVLRALRS